MHDNKWVVVRRPKGDEGNYLVQFLDTGDLIATKMYDHVGVLFALEVDGWLDDGELLVMDLIPDPDKEIPPLEMRVGNFFKIEGYQEMARAETKNGWIVVLSNNSSYLLVASIVEKAMTEGEGTVARLEASYYYSGPTPDMNWKSFYGTALNKMTWLAIEQTEEP